jgi:hypothetical protein
VRRFWKRDDGLVELERDLRARRTAAPPAFIRVLAQRAGGEARWLRPRARVGLAAGLAVIALVAVASAGGFSAAQSTTHSAVKVIKKLGTSSPTSSSVVASAAADQYKGKCGKRPKPRCKVKINDVTALEGNSGTTAFTFTVCLDKPTLDPIIVTWSTRDGTAMAGSDYVSDADTLVFAPGEQCKTITIAVVGDTIKEANETFFVDISSSDADVTRTPGKGTIRNDDR